MKTAKYYVKVIETGLASPEEVIQTVIDATTKDNHKIMIVFAEYASSKYTQLAGGIWIKKGLSSMHPDYENYSTEYILDQFNNKK